MKTHAIIPLVLALVAVAAGRPSAQSAGTPGAGHWEGAIEAPNQALEIQVDLASLQAETWEGSITIPRQGLTGYPLSDVHVDNGTVTFVMKGVPGTPAFKGTLASGAQAISAPRLSETARTSSRGRRTSASRT